MVDLRVFESFNMCRQSPLFRNCGTSGPTFHREILSVSLLLELVVNYNHCLTSKFVQPAYSSAALAGNQQ